MNRAIRYLLHYINGTTADNLIQKVFWKFHIYFIKSSMGIFNALAIFFRVSIVGLSCFPASMLIIVLLETSARRANFSCDKPVFSRHRFTVFAMLFLLDSNI